MEQTTTTECPVTIALKILGGKWRIPLLWKLSSGPVRYNSLKRQLKGITNIMLTRSLRELENANLIRRIQYSDIPPHVEYSLTEEGKKLLPALNIIKEWGLELIDNERLNL